MAAMNHFPGEDKEIIIQINKSCTVMASDTEIYCIIAKKIERTPNLQASVDMDQRLVL